MKHYLLCSLFILFFGAAYAEVTPQSDAGDPHIKVATYDANQVYRVNALQGYITSIQFGADEKILSVNIGDSSSWLVSVQNDIVNLKPTTDHPETNMNVLTTRGAYQFLLTAPARADVSQPQKNTAFLLRFRYPDQNKNALSAANPPTSEPRVKNGHYSARGNPDVAPLSVFDDGKFTYFYFGDHKDIPAIFTVDQQKNESLVNFHLENHYVVVETVSRQFTLRNGNQVASVFNDEVK